MPISLDEARQHTSTHVAVGLCKIGKAERKNEAERGSQQSGTGGQAPVALATETLLLLVCCYGAAFSRTKELVPRQGKERFLLF